MKAVACLLAVVLAFAFMSVRPAEAGSSTDAALALGSFAVLNQLVHGDTILHDLFGRPRPVRTVVVQQPPVVYAPPPPVVYAPPPPVVYAPPPVVYYTPAPVVYAPAHRHFIPPGHAKKLRHGYWQHR